MAMELLTLKSMLLLFGERKLLYNLDEMEIAMIFYKTMKKIVFHLIQYLRKVPIT